MPPGYKYWFYVYRMRCWGVLSFDDFDPFAKVTYGQVKDYLIKTMDWNKKYSEASSHFTLTKVTERTSDYLCNTIDVPLS